MAAISVVFDSTSVSPTKSSLSVIPRIENGTVSATFHPVSAVMIEQENGTTSTPFLKNSSIGNEDITNTNKTEAVEAQPDFIELKVCE